MFSRFGRDRWRAGGAHLAVSLAVALAALLAIQHVWYPGGLFAGAGGQQLFLLIAMVNIVLGPLLTFIIFVPGKKGLAFDLAVIVLLQVAALFYGVWALLEARPVYLVFVKDRFELVRANQIPEVELQRGAGGAFVPLPLTGPRVAGSRMPQDPEEVERLTFAAASGVDLHYFPRHYVPYDEVRSDVRGFARPLAGLREFNPGQAAAIDELPAILGRKAENLVFLPLRAGKTDLTIVLDGETGDVLRIAELRPWKY